MKHIFLLLILMSVQSLFSQGIRDAIRLSESQNLATARVIGMGGAYAALGGDMGTISYNPATLAVYRSGEFSLGFSSNKTTSEAELQGGGMGPYESASKRRFKLENAGLVFHDRPGGASWTTSNFYFGITRIANFDQLMVYEGKNAGSFTDRFLDKANGLDVESLNPFESQLAYDVYAIDGPDTQNEYFADYNPGDELNRREEIVSRGGMSEMTFAYGANYNEKLLLGFSVGIPFVNYDEEKYYVESASSNESVFRKLEYDQELSTSGIGVNFKAGAIAVINQIFRVGGAVHSPTYFSLSDDYSSSMYYVRDENGEEIYEQDSPYGNFDYKFRTPWRFMGSFASVFKIGDLGILVDLEGEYTDYTTGSFDFTAYSNSFGEVQHENEENANIRNSLKPAITYRIGGELSYDKWRFRGGYILPDTPYEGDKHLDVIPGYSFGLGFRSWHYYVDFGYIHQKQNYGYYPYQLENEDLEQFVGVGKTNAKWMLTFGRKF